MSATYTLEQAPCIPKRGRPRSALRDHLEAMEPMQVLKARGVVTSNHVYNAVRQCRPKKFRCCKVHQGFDIYRIS